MTFASKALTGLLVSAIALAGAFGGGYYVDMKQRLLVEKQLEAAQKKAAEGAEVHSKELLRARARTQLIEAALAVTYMNYGMAFDRVVRTQGVGVRVGLTVQPEIDEINTLLMQQKPESLPKLLTLADKFEPVTGLALPNTVPPSTAARKPAPLPGAAAATALPGAAAATPSAQVAPLRPTHADVGKDLEPIREALRQAKESLLVGGEYPEIARKLARAQVLLNEAGNASLDDELGGAIKAARARDEARVRAGIEAALASLRSP